MAVAAAAGVAGDGIEVGTGVDSTVAVLLEVIGIAQIVVSSPLVLPGACPGRPRSRPKQAWQPRESSRGGLPPGFVVVEGPAAAGTAESGVVELVLVVADIQEPVAAVAE